MLDFDKLEELAEIADGDGGFLAHVVGQFDTDSTKSLAELRQALNAGNAAAVGQLAHRIKSGAGALGCTRLFEQCRRVEKFDGGLTELAGEVERLAADVAEAIAAVKAHFGLDPATAQAA